MPFTPLQYNNVHTHTPKQEMKETPYSPPILRPSAARRTPSFSSSSRSNSWDSSLELSSFSFNEESPPYSPSTPLKFKGIPFSWEQIPGIPKHQQAGFKKKESSSAHLLPLPPAGNSNSSTKKLQNQQDISPKNKYHTSTRFQRDPFLAALMECSKDDDDDDGTIWKGSSKISRSLSDRFGIGFINMSASCKRTCTVSESIVYLPSRPTPHYLLHRRSRPANSSSSPHVLLGGCLWIYRTSQAVPRSCCSKMSRRYDSRTTIFSPEGRLYQVEYAMEAIGNAGSAIGILATDGVVLVGEKKVISKLLETSTSVEKMYKIDDHVACAVAGIMSDANILINTARLQAQRYAYAYQEPMPVEQLVQSLCDTKQGYTQFGGLRPFGVSFLFAGWDKNFGFQLYMSDPSGNFAGWKAAAIGANNQAAQSILKQDYKDDITREEAVQLAIKVLSKTMDSTSLNSDKLELAEIFLSSGKVKFQICSADNLNKLLVKSGLTQPSPDA